MSDIAESLRTFLLADPVIKAIVGERIDPDVLPDNPEYPAITIHVGSAESFSHLNGASGITEDTTQVDIYSNARRTTNNLAELIRKRIQNYRGKMGDDFIRGVTFEGKVDLSDAPVDGSGVWVYRRSLDFEIVTSEDTTITKP